MMRSVVDGARAYSKVVNHSFYKNITNGTKKIELHRADSTTTWDRHLMPAEEMEGAATIAEKIEDVPEDTDLMVLMERLHTSPMDPSWHWTFECFKKVAGKAAQYLKTVHGRPDKEKTEDKVGKGKANDGTVEDGKSDDTQGGFTKYTPFS